MAIFLGLFVPGMGYNKILFLTLSISRSILIKNRNLYFLIIMSNCQAYYQLTMISEWPLLYGICFSPNIYGQSKCPSSAVSFSDLGQMSGSTLVVKRRFVRPRTYNVVYHVVESICVVHSEAAIWKEDIIYPEKRHHRSAYVNISIVGSVKPILRSFFHLPP